MRKHTKSRDNPEEVSSLLYYLGLRDKVISILKRMIRYSIGNELLAKVELGLIHKDTRIYDAVKQIKLQPAGTLEENIPSIMASFITDKEISCSVLVIYHMREKRVVVDFGYDRFLEYLERDKISSDLIREHIFRHVLATFKKSPKKIEKRLHEKFSNHFVIFLITLSESGKKLESKASLLLNIKRKE